MTRLEWLTGLAAVGMLALLPLAGYWLRDRNPRCDFNGGVIEPTYAVSVVDAEGAHRTFCCIGCAAEWLERTGRPPHAVLVTDEVDGTPVDAALAYFVWSPVITNRASGNHIHAFRSRTSALEHAALRGSCLLDGSDRPFARSFRP